MNALPFLQLDYSDSSGRYYLALFPGRDCARVLWEGADAPVTGVARWATDDEQSALHYGATWDEATPYSDATGETVGILGALEDYGVTGDLALLSPDWDRAIIVTLDYPERPDAKAWRVTLTANGSADTFRMLGVTVGDVAEFAMAQIGAQSVTIESLEGW